MITIVINSFKGGTAKTSTALHLGAALAKFHSKHVLLVDFDPQANLSSGIGIGCDCLNTMVPVLQGDKPIATVIQDTCVHNLSLIPANTYLDGIERTSALISDPYSHERFRKSLSLLDFDYCLIDVPPSLGWLTQSAFFASNYSLLATTPEPYSLLALNRLAKFHAMINEHHRIELLGVLLSLMDPRSSTNDIFCEGILGVFPNKLFHTTVRRDVAVSRSILQGKPVFDAYPKSRVVDDYKRLANEVLEKCHSHVRKQVANHE